MAHTIDLDQHFRHFLEMVGSDLYTHWLAGLYTIDDVLEIDPHLRPHWLQFKADVVDKELA